jgi:outer membrane protein
MNKIRYALLALSVAAASANAQEGLIEIYQRALMNDPVIREAEANFLATSEVKDQARSSLLPTLTFSGSTSDGYSENTTPLDFVSGNPSFLITRTEVDSNSSGLT